MNDHVGSYMYYRKLIARFFTGLLILFFLSSCEENGVEDRSVNWKPTVILVSLDGFRWDYREKTDTPNLDRLQDTGVRAQALIPVFPSKTFPNHYTIVTGLYPENHGIVSNSMYDPGFDAWYWIGDGSEPVTESRWYAGEPIWVTAERQGQITATMFWPGSEANIQGYRPTYWHTYDGSLSNSSRVENVFDWLDMDDDKRPTLITLYFSNTDSYGHRYGPDAQELLTAIEELDQRIGQLIKGLEKRDLWDEVNLIILSDHGMSQLSRDRIIFLDDYIDVTQDTIVNWSPVLEIRATEPRVDSLYLQLFNAHPQLTVYKKEDLPERLHYSNHDRIGPLIGVADEGWAITSRTYFDSYPDLYTGGAHGYDPEFSSMQGIFIAHGSFFKSGTVVPAFENIHIYSLLAKILGLEPAENDGNLEAVSGLFK